MRYVRLIYIPFFNERLIEKLREIKKSIIEKKLKEKSNQDDDRSKFLLLFYRFLKNSNFRNEILKILRIY